MNSRNIMPRTYMIWLALLLGLSGSCIVIHTLFRPGTIDKKSAFPGAEIRNQQPFDFENDDDTKTFTLSGQYLSPISSLNESQAQSYIPARLGILVGTHGIDEVDGTGSLFLDHCEYRFRGRIRDNQEIQFERTETPCETFSPNGEFQIFVVSQDLLKLSAWVGETRLKHSSSALFLNLKPEENLYLLGTAVYTSLGGSVFSRLEKISKLWSLPTSVVAIMLMGSLLAVLVGLVFFWRGSAFSVGLVCLGISMSTALIVPPLQGPDEPDHFWSYLKITGQGNEIEQLKAFAKRVHLERVKFRRHETFSSFDVQSSHHKHWSDHVAAANVKKRSYLSTLYWKGIGSLLRGNSFTLQLLGMRFLSVVFLSLLLGFVASFGMIYLMAAFMLVPFLPYSSSYHSDYNVLTCLVTLFMALTYRASFSLNKKWAEYGFAAGYAIIASLFLLEPRSAIPIIGLGCALVAGYRLDRGKKNKAKWFWLVSGAIFCSLLLLYSAMEIQSFNYKLYWLRMKSHPSLDTVWVALGCACLGFLCLQLIEVASVKLDSIRRSLIPDRFRDYLWIAIALSLFASLFVPLPNLPDIEQDKSVKLSSYLVDIYSVYFIWFRLTEIDHYIHATYLAGFGWLETIPSVTYLAYLIAATPFVAVVVGSPTKQRRTLLGFIVISLGVIGTAGLYGILAKRIPNNLHGRYLMGFNMLLFVALCYYVRIPWFLPAPLKRLFTSPQNRRQILILLIGLTYSYIVPFLLVRYY